MPISAAVGIGTLAYGAYTAYKSKQEKDKADAATRSAIANRPDYQPSPYAAEALADARSRLYAQSPAVLAAMRQANQGAANQLGYAERNAGSGAQALAVGGAAQSQAQGQYAQLAEAQQQYAQQQQAGYYQALQGMDADYQRQYESRMGKYSDLTNFYLGQVGAANANQSQGLQLAATGIASLAGNANLRRSVTAKPMQQFVTTQPAAIAPVASRQLPVAPMGTPQLSKVAAADYGPASVWNAGYNPFLSGYYNRMY